MRGFSVVSHSTFGIISPRPLKRVISGLLRPLPCSFSIRSLCAVVQRPVGFLADVDAIERRLREEDAALRDQAGHVAVDERQQQRRDVMAVGVGVGEDDDLAVAQPRRVEVLAEPAAERGDQVRQLLVLEHLRERRALGVEHLAAQRQDRLRRAIASLLGGPAGRVTFDDEDLADSSRFGGRAVTELAGQREPR